MFVCVHIQVDLCSHCLEILVLTQSVSFKHCRSFHVTVSFSFLSHLANTELYLTWESGWLSLDHKVSERTEPTRWFTKQTAANSAHFLPYISEAPSFSSLESVQLRDISQYLTPCMSAACLYSEREKKIRQHIRQIFRAVALAKKKGCVPNCC